MLYRLADGNVIDTARDLDFEERNFIQKMVIYERLNMDLEDFRSRWRAPGNPLWAGPSSLSNPTPAVRIVLDLERRIREKGP